MMKQLLAILLAAALLWSLGACGQQGAETVQPSQTENVSMEQPAQTQEPVQTPQAEADSAAEVEEAVDTVIAHSDNDMFTDRDYEIGYEESESAGDAER